MGTTWTNNSFYFDVLIFSTTYLALIYALIAVGTIIILHSAYLHRKKYNTIRLQTELSAVSALISGIILLLLRFCAVADGNAAAFLFDFLYAGFFPLVIQLCDNYMFYSRLKAVSKVQTWKRCAIHAYVFIILSASWFPIYSIVPFFYDTNNSDLAYYYFITLSIQVWGTVLYNFYFTLEFSAILNGINKGKASQTDAIRRTASLRAIIAVKSIIHCMTSSLASLIYLYIPDVGNPIYVLLIILGMHFLFNSKIEKFVMYMLVFCPSLLSIISSSSTQIYVCPSDLSDCNGLKRYRDVSLDHESTVDTPDQKSTPNIWPL